MGAGRRDSWSWEERRAERQGQTALANTRACILSLSALTSLCSRTLRPLEAVIDLVVVSKSLELMMRERGNSGFSGGPGGLADWKQDVVAQEQQEQLLGKRGERSQGERNE